MEIVRQWRLLYMITTETVRLVGFMEDHEKYRMTSPVVSFDSQSGDIFTWTGSHYRLSGPPADFQFPNHTLLGYRAFIDVTDELVRNPTAVGSGSDEDAGALFKVRETVRRREMVKYHGRDPNDGRPMLSGEDGDSSEDLQRAAESVGIWKSVSVENAPNMRVTHWIVYSFRGEEDVMILASYRPATREGRVSTMITGIDAENMRIETQSGRVYELDGPPAVELHPDTSWVLELHFQRLGLELNRLVDVTSKLFPKFYSA